MTEYFYSTNSDGTTFGGFVPFSRKNNPDYARAPDWYDNPLRECGGALHVADHPLGTLAYCQRDEHPIIYRVNPIKLMPKRGGKYRCKALRRQRTKTGKLRTVRITESVLRSGLKHVDPNVRTEAAKSEYATADILKLALKDKLTAVRRDAVRNKKATAAVLRLALEDTYWFIRLTALDNDNVTRSILNLALKDTEAVVTTLAKHKLKKLGSAGKKR